MSRICPNPERWHEIFERLARHAKSCRRDPPSPPVPLILAGWAYSNDIEKLRRWEETVAWAKDNGCPEIVNVPEEDFYYVEEPTSYAVGPGGGPMYRPWDFEGKDRPPLEQLAQHIETLKARWQDIAGPVLAQCTRPLWFTGAKARRLLVHADDSVRPPWGGWSHLSALQSERRTFTLFRASINRAIAPHEIDHVGFIKERQAE